MSMEITNNYSNYAANYVNTVKKSDSRAAAEVKTNISTNSKDKVQAYYEQLCKKFPQINFNINGGVLPSNRSGVTVNLSYDCWKKMANAPEFAKEIEWNLSGEVAANSMVYGRGRKSSGTAGRKKRATRPSLTGNFGRQCS